MRKAGDTEAMVSVERILGVPMSVLQSPDTNEFKPEIESLFKRVGTSNSQALSTHAHSFFAFAVTPFLGF